MPLFLNKQIKSDFNYKENLKIKLRQKCYIEDDQVKKEIETKLSGEILNKEIFKRCTNPKECLTADLLESG